MTNACRLDKYLWGCRGDIYDMIDFHRCPIAKVLAKEVEGLVGR